MQLIRFNFVASCLFDVISAHLAISTMLMRGRHRYGEGQSLGRPAGRWLRISSSQSLCHERATINGVHLQTKVKVIGESNPKASKQKCIVGRKRFLFSLHIKIYTSLSAVATLVEGRLMTRFTANMKMEIVSTI